ncbi:histidine kinase N-terminal 7TM domain-containing protein [Halobacteriales archaeon Cl-PHB]
MSQLLAWPVVGSIAAGLGTLFLLLQIRTYRDKPGANWFLVSLAGGTVWCFGYAGALLVFDPVWRLGAAMLVWLAMNVTGITFLGFALVYTGRGRLVRSWWYRLFLVAAAAMSLFVLTNPLHGLMWTEFAIDPVLGLSTVAYTFGPLAYLTVGGGILAVLTGSLILFDTVISYGPLYRREAVAVGLSTLPPVVGLAVWLFQLGPVPQLHLTTVLFLPHVVLDAYAFLGSDMFEFSPATRRTGERAAIQDLGSPVVIVDEQGRLVTFNAAAETTFDLERPADLTRSLEGLLDGDSVDPTAGARTVSVDTTGGRRQYSVTPAELEDDTGAPVGYTIVFQDVTAERRRKQRLEVLNRILRHNLRNDMMVVRMSLEQAEQAVDDPTEVETMERGLRKADDLVAVSEKARSVEKALEAAEGEPERIDLAPLVRDVASSVDRDAVTTSVPDDLTLATSPRLLSVVLENLVENGVVHDPDDPAVTVDAERDGDAVVATVTDTGPGIPDHELDVLAAGRESDLAHASGLGLWIVDWGVRTLGGTMRVDTGADGTAVRLRFPDG